MTKIILLTTCITVMQLFPFRAFADVVFTNVLSFPAGHHYDGQPHGLTLGKDGNFYGTTELGGQNNAGTVFKMTPAGKLIWSVPLTGKNGSSPEAGLLQDQFGFLYGTASYGGRFGAGTIFTLLPNGRFLGFVSFNGTNGANPEAKLIAAPDGNFYGTTSGGGANEFGTVFKVNSIGQIITLHSFTGNADGAQPITGLVYGTDDNFYGTTSLGGGGYGTIFKITSRGVLTTVYSFGQITNSEGVSLDGSHPGAELVQDHDHNFYGTTGDGGVNGFGTVFKMTSTGSLVWSLSFARTNGYAPHGKLVAGADGNFYGDTLFGGENNLSGFDGYVGFGTVFKITPDGELTSLYSFDHETDIYGYPLDGAFPSAGLIQGANGNIYGATAGGWLNAGAIFRLSTNP